MLLLELPVQLLEAIAVRLQGVVAINAQNGRAGTEATNLGS